MGKKKNGLIFPSVDWLSENFGTVIFREVLAETKDMFLDSAICGKEMWLREI